MGAPLIDPARLGNWLGLGTLEGDDLTRANEVVDTISGFVRYESRQEDWDASTVPEAAAGITLMVSVECFSNPDGKTSVTIEEITRRWESGDLFSRSQLSTLRSFRPNQTSGLGTVGFTRGMDAPSIAIRRGLPTAPRPSGSAVSNPVAGGNPVVLYDGRGY